MNQKPKNRITYWLKIAVIGIVLGLGLQFVRAWTEPSEAPPGGNVGAPINTGANQQWKGLGGIGSMALTGVLEAFNLKVDSKLDTAGNILPDVTGKFLVAKDTSGQLAWAPGGGGTPAGVISAFGGTTAPAGYLLCDGANNISRAAYPALFAVIGTTYGAGSAGDTFKLPDLRQKFPMGKAAGGTGATLGGTGGIVDASISAPAHKHNLESTDIIQDGSGTYFVLYSKIGYDSSFPELYPVLYGVDNSGAKYPYGVHGTASAGGGAGIVYNPPFQTVNYIIKY